MRNRVAVMHGVNLDMLDRRPAELYGGRLRDEPDLAGGIVVGRDVWAAHVTQPTYRTVFVNAEDHLAFEGAVQAIFAALEAAGVAGPQRRDDPGGGDRLHRRSPP